MTTEVRYSIVQGSAAEGEKFCQGVRQLLQLGYELAGDLQVVVSGREIGWFQALVLRPVRSPSNAQ